MHFIVAREVSGQPRSWAAAENVGQLDAAPSTPCPIGLMKLRSDQQLH